MHDMDNGTFDWFENMFLHWGELLAKISLFLVGGCCIGPCIKALIQKVVGHSTVTQQHQHSDCDTIPLTNAPETTSNPDLSTVRITSLDGHGQSRPMGLIPQKLLQVIWT